MKTKSLFALILIIFAANNGHAQFNERIGSGRPGNANNAYTVGAGVYQIQTGHNYFNTKIDPSADAEGIIPEEVISHAPDVLFRIGIKEDLELRLGGVFVLSNQIAATDSSIAEERSGVEGCYIGFRQHVFEQSGFWPALAIQFNTDFGGSKDFKKDNPDPRLRFNFTNLMGQKLNLNWNFIRR